MRLTDEQRRVKKRLKNQRWYRRHYPKNRALYAARAKARKKRNPQRCAEQERQSRARCKARHPEKYKRSLEEFKAKKRGETARLNHLREMAITGAILTLDELMEMRYLERRKAEYARQTKKWHDAQPKMPPLPKRTPEETKLVVRVRQRISKLTKRGKFTKSASTLELVGCSPIELMTHLESQFIEGMSWENYGKGDGKWHIDHILPCKHFNLLDPAEQKKCFHYTNLQPLWEIDNLKKGAKVQAMNLKNVEAKNRLLNQP